MGDPAFTPADLALFADLDRAATTTGRALYLIGAGAIRLGGDALWKPRLARHTRDWDFAVRVDSWEQYGELVDVLASPGGGFRRTRIQHRLAHREGGTLDAIPFGSIEAPPGSLTWPDGNVMNTTGLAVLEAHHHLRVLQDVTLRTASLPAIIGLKLLAYLDRRDRGVLRDIQDVHELLRESEEVNPGRRLLDECMDRFGTGELGYGEAGAYLLGRDVGATFPQSALAPMLSLLEALEGESSPVIGDVQRAQGSSGLRQTAILDRFRAFHMGLLDSDR